MMFVFDTSAFRILFKHYYESRFPTLWDNFNQMVEDNKILSVKEVANELESIEDKLNQWSKDNKSIFQTPNEKEVEYLFKIFEGKHFKDNIEKKKVLLGQPVADPFIVAKAKAHNAIVVTQELHKPHAVKIPNICEFLQVEYTNLEGFMEKVGWKF